MKLRVLVFGLTKNFGGIESFFVNHLNHKDSKMVFDFVLPTKTSYENSLRENGANIHYINSSRRKKPLKYYKEMKKIFKNNRYDYVWQNVMSRSNLVPITMASKNGIKTILHIHGSGHTESGLISRFLDVINLKKMYKYTDVYFTCSEKSSRFAFKKKYKEAIFIPNAISFKKFKFKEKDRKKIRNEFGLDEETFILGNVARLTPVKNLFFLIDIFRNINETIKNSVLMIVGDGILEKELKDYTKKMNLQNDVIFLGSRDDVNKILSSMDAYVMPSISEGLPISLVEAQASSLNIYTSDVVTREVSISSKIKFLSLNETSLEWAQHILKDYIEGYINKEAKILHESVDFDVRENMNKITKLLEKIKSDTGGKK